MSGENGPGHEDSTAEEALHRAQTTAALLTEKLVHDEAAKEEKSQGLDTPDGRLIERYGLPEDQDGSGVIQRLQDERDGISPAERLKRNISQNT